MSEDQSSLVTLKVRVTPEFREKIISSAKENSRSMNAEIVHRLEQSFLESTEVNVNFDKKSAEVMTQVLSDSMAKILTALSEQGVEDIKIITALKKNQKK